MKLVTTISLHENMSYLAQVLGWEETLNSN